MASFDGSGPSSGDRGRTGTDSRGIQLPLGPPSGSPFWFLVVDKYLTKLSDVLLLFIGASSISVTGDKRPKEEPFLRASFVITKMLTQIHKATQKIMTNNQLSPIKLLTIRRDLFLGPLSRFRVRR